jgi:hypothetical protein
MRASVPAALAASVALFALSGALAADKSSKPRLAVLEIAAPGGGTAAKGKDDHRDHIEIYSVSWGTTRAQADALTDGLLVIRYNQDGTAAVPARVSKVDAFSIKQKAVEESAGRANDRLRTAGPATGWPAATGANETLTVGGGRTEAPVIGSTKWKNIVLKRGVETTARGGVRVAAGDVTGDGAAASGQATGKRQHMPIRIRTYDAPLPRGSVLLRTSQPWSQCRVGDRFNGAYLVVGTSHRYQLGGATIVGCSADAVAVNYSSLIAQAGAD